VGVKTIAEEVAEARGCSGRGGWCDQKQRAINRCKQQPRAWTEAKDFLKPEVWKYQK